MTEDARRRAEGCFALARRSTFPHEVTTAVERGKRICQRHGLDLDEFVIPGRSPARRRVDDRLFEGGPHNGFEYVDIVLDSAQIQTALQELQEALSRQFSTKLAAEARRRERHGWLVRDAMAFLMARGVRIYRDPESDRYLAPEEGDGLDLNGDGVINLARGRGFSR